MKLLLEKLDHISELISENTDAAAQELETFKTKHRPFTQKQIAAKVDLLTLVIASVRNTFDKQGIDDKKLKSYFEKKNMFDEAAQVLLAKARHFFMMGNLNEGEKILNYIREELLNNISAKVEIVYLTRVAFLYGRRHQYDEQTKVSLEALEKLKAMGEQSVWHYNLRTIFATNIANAYLVSSSFDKSWEYLQEALEIAERQNISIYNKYNVYSHFSYYYEAKGDWLMSATWHERIIDMLKGDATHIFYLCSTYLSANVQFSYLFRQIPASNKKERKSLILKQEQYLVEALAIVKPGLDSGQYLMLLYVTARLEYQREDYAKAAAHLDTCLRAYTKLQHHNSIFNCTRLAHEVYFAWGKQTGDTQKLIKAYQFKQKESEMAEAESQQSHFEKLERVQAKHNLVQSELNGKLLQQQVESMNKEIRFTAINLHEKTNLLDELKNYVLSLKKNDYDKNQFIRAISQKIGSVKITEQDKAVLQQKIDEGNLGFFQAISDRYPALTSHEVRTCGLLKTGMTDKEMSKLYGLSERGYEQLRYRIKKKMKLGRKENLVKHLVDLSATGK